MQASAIDTIPAFQTAQAELTRIERRRNPEHGRWQEHYRLVVDCLRRYLAQQYNVQTSNRSVAEMQRALRGSALSSAQTQPLLELLAENVTVQTATYLPGPTGGRQLIGRARAMIEQMMPVSTSTG